MNGIKLKYSIPDRLIRLSFNKPSRRYSKQEFKKLFKTGKLVYVDWDFARKVLIQNGSRQKKDSASAETDADNVTGVQGSGSNEA